MEISKFKKEREREYESSSFGDRSGVDKMAPTASELESEVSFLQNLVFRLSQEVSRNAPTDERREETKRVLDELPDHVRVPQWLTSVDVLSPLLRAFDSCTDELKRNIEDQLERLLTQLDDIEGLQEELSAEEYASMKQVLGHSSPPRHRPSPSQRPPSRLPAFPPTVPAFRLRTR